MLTPSFQETTLAENYEKPWARAAAYKIGMLKILELRKKAQTKLGRLFDIREFHDVIITSGPVPLNILEELVDDWIASKNQIQEQQKDLRITLRI